MRKGLRLLLCAALYASSAIAQNAAASYVNARFSYRVEYPKALLVPGGEAANGDGQKFSSADGQFVVRVWGQHNALDTAVAAECEQQIRWEQDKHPFNPSYKVVRKDWFAFSGVTGSTIIYQKTLLQDGVFKTVRLEYPLAQKDTLDPAVRAIVASFRSLPAQ